MAPTLSPSEAIRPDAGAGAALWSRPLPSPVGVLTAVASEVGLRAVLWPKHPTRLVRLTPEPLDAGPHHEVLDVAAVQLSEYFAGERREFDVPLDLVGTPFQLQVWAALRRIPYGSTTTYGELARVLGRPGSARAVGTAVGRNPVSIIVPCHRVVGADGSLTGFAGGIDTKARLLGLESAP